MADDADIDIDVTVTAKRGNGAAPAPVRPAASRKSPRDFAGPDELVLTAGGQRVAGWQAVRVRRSVEGMPSAFSIELTEKYPAVPQDLVILPGQVCTVEIGGDLVLTGYIDRVLPVITGESHTVQVIGRSACEDLVDCSLIWDSNQISGTSVRDAAEKLSKPYGVTVTAKDGDGRAIPQLNTNLGETPYEVIERLARFSAMLSYDDPTGNLVLAQVGTSRHSSGFTQGVNVLRAAGTFALDQRYSEYHAYLLAQVSLGELGTSGNEKSVVLDPGMQGLKRPDGQKRVRKLAIISEQNFDGQALTEQRAKWEMTRRFGRSQAVRVEADSWRDSEGKLWEPNWRVPVDIPACKVNGIEAVIAEVDYVRDDRGTRAELMLMPPEAFMTEPTPLLSPFAQQVADATAGAPNPVTPNNVRANQGLSNASNYNHTRDG